MDYRYTTLEEEEIAHENPVAIKLHPVAERVLTIIGAIIMLALVIVCGKQAKAKDPDLVVVEIVTDYNDFGS